MQFKIFSIIRTLCEFYCFQKTGADCNKKWINIRDQYNKNKNKKLGTGSAAESKTRRNELMAFLNEIVTVNKK